MILDVPHNVFKHFKINYFYQQQRKTNIRESASFMFKIAAFKSAANHRAQAVKVALVW